MLLIHSLHNGKLKHKFSVLVACLRLYESEMLQKMEKSRMKNNSPESHEQHESEENWNKNEEPENFLKI